MIEDRFRRHQHNVFRVNIYPECFSFYEACEYYNVVYDFTEAEGVRWLALWELIRNVPH